MPNFINKIQFESEFCKGFAIAFFSAKTMICFQFKKKMIVNLVEQIFKRVLKLGQKSIFQPIFNIQKALEIKT